MQLANGERTDDENRSIIRPFAFTDTSNTRHALTGWGANETMAADDQHSGRLTVSRSFFGSCDEAVNLTKARFTIPWSSQKACCHSSPSRWILY